MSTKSLPSKFLYVIHANNTVSKIPYFTEHSSFVRLLIKQRREDNNNNNAATTTTTTADRVKPATHTEQELVGDKA